MKIKINRIERDKGGFGYYLNYKDHPYSHRLRDRVAGISVDWKELCQILANNGYAIERIGEVFRKLEEVDQLSIDLTIDDPDVTDDPSRIMIDFYEDYGYVLNSEGNPVEIDAPNSPLRELGLV